MADEHHDPKFAVHQHVTPKSVYFVIFGALMVLTAFTVWIALQDLGFLNTPMALGVATIKATLVILYFMHVRHATRLTWVVVVGSFLWLGVLFVLTYSDYLSRHVSHV
jgi:cytochrome c oxidase subunit 4